MSFLIQQKSTKLYLHKVLDDGTVHGQCYVFYETDVGAYSVETRQEGKDLIRFINPNFSVNDFSFRKQ